MKTLVLASSSPRRIEWLTKLKIPFTQRSADCDETILPNEGMDSAVARLSIAKAFAVSELYPESYILGVDTLVGIDDKILGKPDNQDQAFEMLKSLQGNTHLVASGYTIYCSQDKYLKTAVCHTKVTICKLSDSEIRDYIDSGEPMDKAGSYAAQGIGAAFIERIDGSYMNVVGIPLVPILEDLKELGIWSMGKLHL